MSLESFFNSDYLKYAIFYFIIFSLIYIKLPLVNQFILDYLTVRKDLQHNHLFKIFIIIPFILLLSLSLYRILHKNYQISHNDLHFVFFITIVYLFTRFLNENSSWNFISFYGNFKYVDLVGILIFSFWFSHFFNKLNIQNESKKKNNGILPDSAIKKPYQDKLKYDEKAGYLFDYIKDLDFDDSFIVAIVSPWGNGKTSFLHLLRNKINENEKNNLIQFWFKPYLNHNESDIISEFFNQFEIHVRKESGLLSNQILKYSHKLLQFQNITSKNIVNNKYNFKSNSSILSTYDEIDKAIKKLNKKFIVFVDDLDRLTSEEVIQVLKLVRNTANFKNVFL